MYLHAYHMFSFRALAQLRLKFVFLRNKTPLPICSYGNSLSRCNMFLCCKSRRVFDLVKRSGVSSHHTSGPTKQNKKNHARRLAWSVLLTPGDYVATACKDRNIINTASSFCCDTASRHTATAEQVTFPISCKRSPFK